jgi:hypothetical protein
MQMNSRKIPAFFKVLILNSANFFVALSNLFVSKQIIVTKTFLYIIILYVTISCTGSKEQENYQTAFVELTETQNKVASNIKRLSDLKQKTGVLQKKINDLKKANTQTNFFFSQIHSASITATKQQQNLLKEVKVKLEANKNLTSNLLDKETQEIKTLTSKGQNIQKEYKNTIIAIEKTIVKIETTSIPKINR